MISHRPIRPLLAIAGLVVVCANPPPAAAKAAGDNVLPGQIIIELRPGQSIDDINAAYGTALISSMETLGLYLVGVPEGVDQQEVLAEMAMDFRVAETEENERTETPEAVEGDTQSFFFYVPPSAFEAQYAVGLLGLGPAHGVSIGSGVIVAVLDTGIDAAHEVLAEMVLPNGYDFVDQDNDVSDLPNGFDDDGDGDIDEMTGHGTAVAGIVAIVAPGVHLLPVRVLDSDGAGDVFRAAQGIYYAIDQGADVINLSLGTESHNQVLRNAVEAAYDAGVLVVASAGNSNLEHPVQMPAGHEDVIGVAATNAGDVKSEFSNYGSHIGVSAPGSEIVSTMPQNLYASCDGTSFSAAFVSGTAALVAALDPEAPLDDVRAALTGTVRNIDALNSDYLGMLGSGRLSTAAAVGVPHNPADLDFDWVVGVSDYLILLAAWNQTDSPADLDGDGVVGVGDFLILLAAWG